eukprot:gene44964-55965_t
MLLFAVTGITLNHAGQIESKPRVVRAQAQAPQALQQVLSERAQSAGKRSAVPPELAQWAHAQWGVSLAGREAEWADDEVYVSLPRPGGDAWLRLGLQDGEAEYENTDRGWIAYLNDLHKGRNTGAAWNWPVHFEDARGQPPLDLAQARAELMDRCRAERPGQALLAVSGLAPPRTGMLAAPCGFHMAIVTGGDSCIIGGPASSQAQAESLLTAAGARVTTLPVEIASHTPLMAGAVTPFAAALRASQLRAAGTPVLSGISAARLASREQAVEHLSRQLDEPIVWDECMDACAEAGITVALELGPGAALTRMMQARHPAIACRSVADFRSLDGIRAWLRRHGG